MIKVHCLEKKANAGYAVQTKMSYALGSYEVGLKQLRPLPSCNYVQLCA